MESAVVAASGSLGGPTPGLAALQALKATPQAGAAIALSRLLLLCSGRAALRSMERSHRVT